MQQVSRVERMLRVAKFTRQTGMTPQANQGWSARLGRVSARQVDLALAVLVTLAGLVLFAYSGIGGNRRAGFLFSRISSFALWTCDLPCGARGRTTIAW